MILSGNEILKEMKNGNIKITPFNENQLNPNSYNLKLADELLIYDVPYHCDMVKDNHIMAPSIHVAMEPLDMLNENSVRRVTIPREGLVIYPGILYLGKTVEYTETHNFVPCIEGRSSIGRLGISIHATASLGNSGFAGSFVLEISCVQPVRIYPNIEVCQIYYQDIKGEIMEYNGRYQSQDDIVPSKLYL